MYTDSILAKPSWEPHISPEAPGIASAAVRSDESPNRSPGNVRGLIGRETQQPQLLETPRDEPARNQTG